MMATGGAALRPGPLRHGGLPGLAPPGRPHDRRRPGVAEDGAGPAPDLRPDDGAQVGHLDGRVRVDAAACSTTTPSSRASTRSCPSTSTRRAARPGPRPCMHAILTLHELDPHRRAHPPPRARPVPAPACSVDQRDGQRRPPPVEPLRQLTWPTPRPTSRPTTDGAAPPSPRRCTARPVTWSRGQRVRAPARDALRRRWSSALRDEGFAHVPRRHRRRLPHLRRRRATLPDGVDARALRGRRRRSSRTPSASRLRLRVQVPEDDPVVPSLFELHPGTEAMEREVFDMFGIALRRPPRPDPHPHARGLGRATRCARTTPSAASRCSSRHRGRPMTATDADRPTSTARRPRSQTAEGDQEMAAAPSTAASRCCASSGAVLRLSEAEAADAGRRRARTRTRR